MVGVPVLGLLGILEAGRGIAAPLSISGDYPIEYEPAAKCASLPASLNISQSGTQALITLNNGQATALDATVTGATLTSKNLTAAISGSAGQRAIEGRMNVAGCAPVAFRAVRQSRKRGD